MGCSWERKGCLSCMIYLFYMQMSLMRVFPFQSGVIALRYFKYLLLAAQNVLYI